MGKLRRLILEGHTLKVEDLYGLNTDQLHAEASLILELPDLPNEILTRLSFHHDPLIRILICEHASISPELLVALASDTNSKVTQAALKQIHKRTYYGWRKWLYYFKILFKAPFKISFILVKGFAVYLLIGFAALLYTDTSNFVSSYNKSSASIKAYAFCTFSTKFLDQNSASGHSCDVFKNSTALPNRGLASIATSRQCLEAISTNPDNLPSECDGK